jgi:hypothetical protein
MMEEYDRKRHRQAKLSENDDNNQESDNYLLEKAQVQLDEEEDEIKKVNEMMLYAKCRAIRDIQLEEKVTMCESSFYPEKKTFTVGNSLRK